MEGVVKMVNKEKGFGFIKPTEGPDVFCGRRDSPAEFDSLEKDDRVSFDVGQSPKGPMATNVKKI